MFSNNFQSITVYNNRTLNSSKIPKPSFLIAEIKIRNRLFNVTGCLIQIGSALFQTAFDQVLERLIKSVTKDSGNICWGRLQHLDAQRIQKKIMHIAYQHVSGYDEYIKDVEWVIEQYNRTFGLGPQVYCIVINQVISYWTSYRSSVSCIGPRPSNTADRGPVTGPIRNNLINEIFIN